MEKSINLPRFSVSDFIALVNQTFEYTYPKIEIEGEIASFKVNQDKYIFFDIKDENGSVSCFMTIWQLRTTIEDGMKVVVIATPKVTQWGKFSLTVQSVRPSGEGAIKKSFDLLRAKLSKEGLFAIERKRDLPLWPVNIAVISSVQAAGYADFIKIINDRWAGMLINVAHVQVQGASAPDKIINAIEYFNQKQVVPEAIVIIRGGGSADDLSAFNDELLVRAVAASRIPTLVGIGHETDETLVDLAADVRAATPSNAAQLLVPDRSELIRTIRFQIQSVIPRLENAVYRNISEINEVKLSLIKRLENNIDQSFDRLKSVSDVLNQLNPNTILRRGYAIVHGVIKIGNMIEIESNNKKIKAEVRDVVAK